MRHVNRLLHGDDNHLDSREVSAVALSPIDSLVASGRDVLTGRAPRRD